MPVAQENVHQDGREDEQDDIAKAPSMLPLAKIVFFVLSSIPERARPGTVVRATVDGLPSVIVTSFIDPATHQR